jgi:DNA-binding transcriptional MocR family regulator
MITLNKQDATPLVDQIINAISKLIDNRALRSGSRLPSIRQFAIQHEISRFTVVQAFDRLVAEGYLHSRPGAGFYVSPRPRQNGEHNSVKLERAMDALWLLRKALSQPGKSPLPGAGWLPHHWLDEEAIQRSLRQLAKQPGSHLTGYGTPKGYPPLRQLLQNRLAEIGIGVESEQLLLTKGAAHALDLLMRFFVRLGDTVLVDDPGYFQLFGLLKMLGAKIVGVPWTPNGPDITILESLLAQHKPKLFFTNSVLHNPTGASISQPVAYQLLKLADQHDLIIIEDDIYGDFHPGQQSRLATLDQLQRVIYISSYSKTLSAAMRVGYIACNHELAQQLTDLKLLTGMTTSEINERLIYQMLVDGYYRKYLGRLHKALQQEKEQALENFERLGLKPYVEPLGGMFIWTAIPEQIDAIELANQAAQQGVTLAPGSLFRPHHEPCQWMRFNVASSNDKKQQNILKKLLDSV